MGTVSLIIIGAIIILLLLCIVALFAAWLCDNKQYRAQQRLREEEYDKAERRRILNKVFLRS